MSTRKSVSTACCPRILERVDLRVRLHGVPNYVFEAFSDGFGPQPRVTQEANGSAQTFSRFWLRKESFDSQFRFVAQFVFSEIVRNKFFVPRCNCKDQGSVGGQFEFILFDQLREGGVEFSGKLQFVLSRQAHSPDPSS